MAASNLTLEGCRKKTILAGFLARGSSYSPRLPIPAYRNSGSLRLSSPLTVAGLLSIFTRFPLHPGKTGMHQNGYFKELQLPSVLNHISNLTISATIVKHFFGEKYKILKKY